MTAKKKKKVRKRKKTIPTPKPDRVAALEKRLEYIESQLVLCNCKHPKAVLTKRGNYKCSVCNYNLSVPEKGK